MLRWLTAIDTDVLRRAIPTQRKSACAAELFRTGITKAHIQGLGGGVDQVDTDCEGMIYAADMLLTQSANVLWVMS